MIADGFFTATMRLGMNAKCGWQHAVALVRKDKQKSCEAWKQRAYANKRVVKLGNKGRMQTKEAMVTAIYIEARVHFCIVLLASDLSRAKCSSLTTSLAHSIFP